jgi:hypothetical protein
VNVLARLFRRLFLQGLERAFEKDKLSFHGACAFLAQPTAFKRLIKSVRAREWWVYAKPPFDGRLRSTMTLRADEFMRRFLLHVLPRGFQRIRQFGLLANRRRGELARCRQLLGTPDQTAETLHQDYQSLYQTVTGTSLQQCPACHTGSMKFFALFVPLINYGAPHNQHRSAAVLQAIDSS